MTAAPLGSGRDAITCGEEGGHERLAPPRWLKRQLFFALSHAAKLRGTSNWAQRLLTDHSPWRGGGLQRWLGNTAARHTTPPGAALYLAKYVHAE